MQITIPKIYIHGWSAVLIFAVLFSMAAIAGAVEFDRAHSGYEALLKQYVSNGRVDYKGLKEAGSKTLERYLDEIAAVTEARFNGWTESERLAFLINLYNAATLKLIVDHYPLKSIKDIGSFFKGPWDRPVVRLFGRTITLDNLEHDIIRKQYGEPRIHLALVCAAKSCPPLRSEVYLASRLETQLDDQSRSFLATPAGLRIEPGRKIVYFSSIFKWYGKDFIERFSPRSGFAGLDKTEKAVANFCSRYLSASQRDYLKAGKYSIEYLDYDWSLNAK